jgi:large subunit ribosomal protein L1
MAKSKTTPEATAEAPAGDKPAAEKPEKKPKKPKEAPGAEGAAPPPPPAAASPEAPAAPAAGGSAPAAEPTAKKKGRKPGVPPRRGKKLRNQLKNQEQKLDKEGVIPVKRAVELLKQSKRVKFDETVELHIKLGIDTTQSDQMVRGAVSLPHGIGKSVRVVVFCQGDNVAKAKEAGADFAGSADLIEKIQKENWLDFDVALATQDLMGQVSRLGKTLGPRGLMPTPKAGTVVPLSQDIGAAVREFKAGKVEYRADKGGNVHAGVGKLSFDVDKLTANIAAFVDQVRASKPAGVKGHYVQGVTVSATMSPGIRVTT